MLATAKKRQKSNFARYQNLTFDFFAEVCSDFGFLFLYLVGVSLVTELVEVTKCRKGKATLCVGDIEKKGKRQILHVTKI